MEANPADTEALKLRGGLLLLLGEPERARVDFSIAIERNPSIADGYDLRGRALYALHRYRDAVSDFNEAIRLEPQNSDALFDRASLYQELRRYDLAVADFNRAISVDPANPALWNGRCWVRMLANSDLPAALDDCRHALKLDPERDDVRDSLGWVWLRLGNPHEAIRNFDAALSLSPGLASSLYGRGVARLAMGDTSRGYSDIRTAKAVEPGIEAKFRSYGIVPRVLPAHPTPRPDVDQAT